MNEKLELSLTIPAYNEEAGIEETLIDLARVFEKHHVAYEIIVVNHGSVDNTHLILERLAKKNTRLVIHNLPKNLGYGGGILYGFSHSKGAYLGFTCADQEVSAEDVYKVYATLLQGGSDATKARRIHRKDGLLRRITTGVFNLLISLRFNLQLKDINGFPLYFKRDILSEVKTKEMAYLFNLDFLRNMRKGGFSIREVPVAHCERKKGKSFMKISRIGKMAWEFVKYAVRVG